MRANKPANRGTGAKTNATQRDVGVGKRTLVEASQAAAAPGAVQRKADGAAASDHAAAERGVQGATSEFPHRQTIETLFGQPVHARAASGGAAAEACDALGAKGYARGDQVAFASPSPDLHLAAHEAAHTLQQRGGVQLAGGFGRGGDPYEQMADEAADRVVRGQSAADLFDAPRGPSSSPPAVQRKIFPDDNPEPQKEDLITTRAAVLRHPQFQGLPDKGLERAIAIAEDEDEMMSVSEVLDIANARNTVVAGVDGSGGKREAEFLKNAWQQNDHVYAYDPAMQQQVLRGMLEKESMPSATTMLDRGSVTNFGTHVPNTDVLVPHPGPWVYMDPPNDLATCLERVLGATSHAYVLTDNEEGSKYAATVKARIEQINTQNAQTPGYVPMTVQVTVPAMHGPARDKTNLNGAEITVGHQPNYRLVTVSR